MHSIIKNSLLLLGLFILLTSCNSTKKSSQKNIPHKEISLSYSTLTADRLNYLLSYGIPEENYNIGFLDPEGKVAIKPVFDNATDFFGNYANIIKDSIFGYVDLNGSLKLFPEYEQVYWYYSDTGFAKNNEKFALINRNGKLITDFIFDQIDLPNEGYFPVEINGNWNHVDSEGNLVFDEDILLNWDQINDSLVVILDSERTESNKNPKQGIMDVSGKVIIEPIYQDVTPVFSEGLMQVKKEDLYGFVNRKGEIVVPIEYQQTAFDFKDQFVYAKKNDKWGFINKKNELVIPFIYDKVRSFSEGLAQVTKNGKSGYINKRNEVVIPLKLEPIWQGEFHKNRAVFKEGVKYGYIDRTGEVVIAPIYDSALPFEDGIAYVEKNGKSGYIDPNGKEIIPISFKQLWGMKVNRIRYRD